MGARPAVREPDAAGVHDPDPVHDPVELHVRVAADHDVRVDASEHVPQPLVGRRAQDHLLVASGRAVAEEDAAEAGDVELDGLRKAGDELAVPLRQLGDDPVAGEPARGDLLAQQLPVGIPADR